MSCKRGSRPVLSVRTLFSPDTSIVRRPCISAESLLTFHVGVVDRPLQCELVGRQFWQQSVINGRVGRLVITSSPPAPADRVCQYAVRKSGSTRPCMVNSIENSWSVESSHKRQIICCTYCSSALV
jgi:hypothetical protein